MADTAAEGDDYRGPIIDTHFHPMLGEEPILGSSPHGPDDYLREIGPLDLKNVCSLVMAPRGDLEGTIEQNNAVLKLNRDRGNLFLPVCSVHPLDGQESLDELDRVCKEGARALKLHPNTQNFDVADPAVEEVVRRAGEHGIPVLFDAYSPFDADQAGKFVMLSVKVPESRIILAHAHGSRFPDLVVYDILSRYPWWTRNVWIDLSATGPMFADSPFAEQFAWVLRKVGIDRLLFGSDYPMDNPRAAVRNILKLPFTKEEFKGIFHDNAAALFKL